MSIDRRRHSVDAQLTYYEAQIVQTVRRLPFRRQQEVLRLLRQMERREQEQPALKEDDIEQPVNRLPRFMQRMIAEGKLKLSNLDQYVEDQPGPSDERLKRFRRYLVENDITIPVEEYIRAERSKR